MDSEGSEIDDLADIDLATFATADRDLNVVPKDTEWYEGRSTETEGDSLGDSMDSRASSDMLQSHEEVSGSLEMRINDASKHGSGTNPFLSHTELVDSESSGDKNNSYSDITLPSNNPFFSAELQNNFDQTFGIDVDMHDNVASSDVEASAEFSSPLPAPGRAGYVQQYVALRRLPGENLGMVLAIEGDQDNLRPVEAVLVRSITPGGAAARAGQDGRCGIHVGDEVREVDGCLLTELTHDQCIEFFQNMPDHVMLTLHRAVPRDQFDLDGDLQSVSNHNALSTEAPVPVPRPRGSVSSRKASDTEETVISSVSSTPRQEGDEGFMRTPRGFVKLDVTVFRGEGDNLGLSIIPSHGATCDLYQVGVAMLILIMISP
ncbi:PDZ domain-containing protein 2 [Elysia marginata]|uniref:PDZ domain-containing protein 2 n=1 Tax=Elysia marginata TaxID=1093978 RepID=A0AAV4EEF7_9GAST|nr:PDZ domain-containing protein 2 [Elysia marginata]